MAVDSLRSVFADLIVSPVYRSSAIGLVGDDFLNAVVGIDTQMPVDEITQQLRAIEDRQGRDRSQPRYSSRTLDLDLLLCDSLIVTTSELALPRDEIANYAFVLQPLADIAADVLHPVLAKSMATMLTDFRLRQPQQFNSLQKVSSAFLDL